MPGANHLRRHWAHAGGRFATLATSLNPHRPECGHACPRGTEQETEPQGVPWVCPASRVFRKLHSEAAHRCLTGPSRDAVAIKPCWKGRCSANVVYTGVVLAGTGVFMTFIFRPP